MGKRGCGSKPFASRLSQFSGLFVNCVVIHLLYFSNFGRRFFPICCSLCELYHGQLSQSLGLWSATLSDSLPVLDNLCELYHNHTYQSLGFSPRLCFDSTRSRFSAIFVGCITFSLCNLSDFGRQLGQEVICFHFLLGSWGPFSLPFPVSFSLLAF